MRMPAGLMSLNTRLIPQTHGNTRTGTWLYTNGIGLYLSFALIAGTSLHASADTWTAGNYIATSNQVNALDSTSNTFKIALVQLEAGSVATTFDARSVGTELALCQRYFCKTFPQDVAPANGLGPAYYFGYSVNSTNPITIWKYPVTLRTSPTVTLYNDRSGGTAGQWTNNSSDGSNARALGTSTEFVMLDNSATAITSGNWWLGGATASAEL
jgi:hypothetical protein